MEVKDVKTTDDVRALIADRNPGHVKVGVFDMDGVMRGKYCLLYTSPSPRDIHHNLVFRIML